MDAWSSDVVSFSDFCEVCNPLLQQTTDMSILSTTSFTNSSVRGSQSLLDLPHCPGFWRTHTFSKDSTHSFVNETPGHLRSTNDCPHTHAHAHPPPHAHTHTYTHTHLPHTLLQFCFCFVLGCELVFLNKFWLDLKLKLCSLLSLYFCGGVFYRSTIFYIPK